MQTYVDKSADVELLWFFRLKLLSLSGDWQQVKQYLNDLDEAQTSIKKQALKIAWYMRGGATYQDVLNFCDEEIKFANQLIEQNLETTKNTKLPFF